MTVKRNKENRTIASSVCYHCGSSIHLRLLVINTCRCGASFAVIPSHSLLKGHGECHRLHSVMLPLAFGSNIRSETRLMLEMSGIKFLHPTRTYPLFVDLSKFNDSLFRQCYFDCSWGAMYYHLTAHPNEASCCGYLIFPIKKQRAKEPIYHGTNRERCLEIFAAGKLLPPSVTGHKTHGFNTEKDLRFAGYDICVAQDHDRGALIELSYASWVAHTHLGLSPAPLLHLLKWLPKEIGAVTFWERGRAIAFRQEATVTVADSTYNQLLLEEISPTLQRWKLFLKRHFAAIRQYLLN